MPLHKGASRETSKANFTQLVMEGNSREKALAITYAIAKNNINRVSPQRRKEVLRNEIFGPGVTINEVLNNGE